jgi:very-short-patch-repair endonuclease
MRTQIDKRSIDHAIAEVAGRQHGVIARRQLLALGVSPDQIRRRVASGRLIVLRRGVYAVGHRALTRRSRWMAAVLAAGHGAVLSHRSAGAFYDICREGPRIEVIARSGRRLALERDEWEIVDGIPVTTPARTLFDLAAITEPHELERAFNQAEYHGLTSPVPLVALLTRHPRRPGANSLRMLLARRVRLRTRTEMEADFLAFLDERHLPRPDDTNVCRTIHGRRIEADAVYIDPRLIIELDGGSHRTYSRFHDDRARDRSNLVDDWRTVRVTSRHLDIPREREELAADLRALLARA